MADKILIAGPWTGEYGWRIMRWQGYLRHVSKDYSMVFVYDDPQYHFLYQDFAHTIPYTKKSTEEHDCWGIDEIDFIPKEELDTIASYFNAEYDYVYPSKKICDDPKLKQKFVVYGKYDGFKAYDLLMHARKHNPNDYQWPKSWPLKNWVYIAKCLKGYKIASIGSVGGADHVEGTKDLRGIPLSELADVMHSSKLVASPISGPNHYAALCNCKSLAWTNSAQWSLGGNRGTNRERHEKEWNPFRVPTITVEKHGWQPEQGKILHVIKEHICLPQKNFKTINVQSKQVVFYSSFNRAMFKELIIDPEAKHPSLEEPWISYRFDIWYKYTWQSILNQSYDNWVYLLFCDPGAKEITDKYFSQIDDERFHIVYTPSSDERLLLRDIGSKSDEIFSIRIDSDDMYHKDLAKEVVEWEGDDEWFYYPNGHIYDENNFNMYKFCYSGTGPFFGRRYSPEGFAELKTIREPSHSEIKLFNPHKFSDYRFMVIIHGKNTTTSERFCKPKNLYDIDKTANLMKEYGIKP